MRSRLLPLVLVAAAAAADALLLHELAFYLLVAAVPAAAIVALTTFGELVDLPGRAAVVPAARVQSGLAALGLVAVVFATAVRAQAPDENVVPAVGVSALVACVVVFAAHALAALAAPAADRELATRSAPRESPPELALAPPAEPEPAAVERAA